MQKNKKFYEVENESKFGKKSYQERLAQEKEAEEQIQSFELEDTNTMYDTGENYKNEQ
jgi:hypothetical protein